MSAVNPWRFLIALIGLLLCFTATISKAQTNGALRVGVQLEPPNLDPTSGAAAAIDDIVYANVFEGLTRILENGDVAPALAERWIYPKMANPIGSIYTKVFRSMMAQPSPVLMWNFRLIVQKRPDRRMHNAQYLN